MNTLHNVQIYGDVEQEKKDILLKMEVLIEPHDLYMLKGIYCISKPYIEEEVIPGIWIEENDGPIEFRINEDQISVSEFPIIIIDRDIKLENFAFVLLHEIAHHKNEFLDGKEDNTLKEKEINAHVYALHKFRKLEGIPTKINNLLYLDDAIELLNEEEN